MKTGTHCSRNLYIFYYIIVLYEKNIGLLIQNRIKTEYLIIIRYGTGFGGGNGKGFIWILSDYQKLGIKYLVTIHCVRGEISETESDKPYPQLTNIYGIDGKQWTKDVPVVWCKLT